MNLILNVRGNFKYYLLLIVLLFAFSCNEETDSEVQGDINTNDISNDTINEPYRFPVIAMKVQKGALSNYIPLNGDIDIKIKAEVFPDIAGKIISLNIKLGTYVKKGQIIATLDPSKPGFTYLKSPVRAPISGYVLAVSCKIGDTVGPQTSIALIGKMDVMQIKTYVSEKYILDVKAGNDAIIELESYPNERFKAKISEVSPVLDFKSRAVAVYLEPVGDNSRKMVVGMFAKIKLITKHLENVVKIPSHAFIEREGKLCVFRLNADTKTVERVFPLIDFEIDNIMSIRDGINEGDLIVIEGISSLSDGAYVDIVDIRDGLDVENNV
ncbi:efflux RND transporter periplasmic adaptor subunit [Borrelia hermsii]|uniref:Acriflavin resistance periplasmic protein n=3 Tax=Borrelia hermsii TaxID=140 RepID=A0AAN0X5V6_BORHE|nr:efflux RND transporter periplasmic adaptor subunit [Borrelia hermsii]AAX16662.1 acriflavin resistance periplasmic protein [Borrelia hermsii DAH]AJW72966.1 membrane protein [Borrelia hermsii CC1]AMR75678.1 Acriflavin resistance periplasmic protein [Borrelia hermsii]ANA42962.1 efflux transporter periplasmic adaptor subunit [Borrelia hermsii HS1]UCP01176.1 efflux RND transporter periplasmic adaptor subunit [Borrelia hermsii]